MDEGLTLKTGQPVDFSVDSGEKRRFGFFCRLCGGITPITTGAEQRGPLGGFECGGCKAAYSAAVDAECPSRLEIERDGIRECTLNELD